MSPEFNFHIKANFPSVDAATDFANGLQDVQPSITEVVVYAEVKRINLEAVSGVGNNVDLLRNQIDIAEQTKGGIIKIERLARGLTQERLAEMTGLSGSMISLLESGKNPGSIRTVRIISEAFSIGIDDPRFKILMEGVKRSNGRTKASKTFEPAS